MFEPGKWHRLLAGSRHLGNLVFDGVEYPSNHFTAIFRPTEAFSEVREIFEAAGIEMALMMGSDRLAKQRARERSEDAWRRLKALDLWIVDPVGEREQVDGFLLNGDQAVFRIGCIGSRKARIRSHDAFWNVLEDEVGPEPCREPECGRLRMSLSVYCKLHHFRMIMHEDYEGTLRDVE